MSPLHLQKRVLSVHFPKTSCTKDHPRQELYRQCLACTVMNFSCSLVAFAILSASNCCPLQVFVVQVVYPLSLNLQQKTMDTEGTHAAGSATLYGRISRHLAHLQSMRLPKKFRTTKPVHFLCVHAKVVPVVPINGRGVINADKLQITSA